MLLIEKQTEAYSNCHNNNNSYNEIADTIIPLLSEDHCSRIASIYVQIDLNNNGYVPVNILKKFYNIAVHPGLKEGRVGIDQVFVIK